MKQRTLCPVPRASDLVDLGWNPKYASPASSQLMPVLLAWNHAWRARPGLEAPGEAEKQELEKTGNSKESEAAEAREERQ